MPPAGEPAGAVSRVHAADAAGRRVRHVARGARRGRHTWLQPALQLTWEEVARLSPLHHLPERAGPLLVSYGGQETAELRRQSEEYLAAWRAKGLHGRRVEQPEADHYTAISGFGDPDSALCRAVVRQVRALRPASPDAAVDGAPDP